MIQFKSQLSLAQQFTALRMYVDELINTHQISTEEYAQQIKNLNEDFNNCMQSKL